LAAFPEKARAAVDALEAWQAFVAGERRAVGPSVGPPHYANLARWLAEQMRLADVPTPHSLEQFNGPDGKTTRKLLDGYGTSRDDVLQKLVDALNEANRHIGRRVTLALDDVPRD
jgi:hypothetical protein